MCKAASDTHTPVTYSPVSLFIARFLKQCWPQHVGLSSPTRTQTHILPWETESSTLDPRNAPRPFLLLTPVTQSTRLPPRRPRSTQPAGTLPSSGSLRLHLRSARVDATLPPGSVRLHLRSARVDATLPLGSLRLHLRSARVDTTLPPGSLRLHLRSLTVSSCLPQRRLSFVPSPLLPLMLTPFQSLHLH